MVGRWRIHAQIITRGTTVTLTTAVPFTPTTSVAVSVAVCVPSVVNACVAVAPAGTLAPSSNVHW
jgi:hypothetical protein